MKVSLKWLSDYVDVSGVAAEDLAERITRSGIEVDSVEERNQGVSGVVVGHVVSREQHPDADKLSVCKVDVGSGKLLQIVCGAKNVAAGQKVPVALVGANLPDGLKIKRAKLRGVESQGMICSARELGLNDRLLPKELQEGILVLPEDAAVGTDVVALLALDDQVLEFDLTPNRSDCLSMLGAAYEVAAILSRGVKLPEPGELPSTGSGRAADQVRVGITATEQCSHYAARLIEGVRIAPSPLWLQNRLMAAGVRPINNIVDITNFVMLEYGQPLHAFDADRIRGGRIDVRLAQAGERIQTLDDVERTLAPDMLVIADGERAVAIAGVMGGAATEVTAGTTRILLESARFDGGSVRKTSRRLGLRSEASLRFEKQVDAQAVIPALERAAALMCAIAGGRAADGIVEAKVGEPAPLTVNLTLARINGHLGTDLSAAEVRAIFERLHFRCELVGADGFAVHVPSRRGDITRDVDLIEEIARLYGYDNIPTSLMSGVTTPGSLTREQAVRRAIRNLLSLSGLQETTTYSFTHPSQIAEYPGLYGEARPIGLAMPMSEERSVLRTSLIPHLLDTAAYNRNRNVDDVLVFELGRVFLSDEAQPTKLPDEHWHLAVLLTGKKHSAHWSGKAEAVDFYDAKGILDKICTYLGVTDAKYTPIQPAGLHPGRSAEVAIGGGAGAGSERLGWIGQLHPALAEAKDLDATYVLEIDLGVLIRHADFHIGYRALPRYPAISRDLAVVVGRDAAVGDLLAKIKETGGDLLESVQVFDLYTGEHVGAGNKSVAFSLVYRHEGRTLTDEEVSKAHETIVQALATTFGAQLRA
jgi:phenylalanyl-tRNA synthetase beta chain